MPAGGVSTPIVTRLVTCNNNNNNAIATTTTALYRDEYSHLSSLFSPFATFSHFISYDRSELDDSFADLEPLDVLHDTVHVFVRFRLLFDKQVRVGAYHL